MFMFFFYFPDILAPYILLFAGGKKELAHLLHPFR